MPSETALKNRARRLLEVMTERERSIYALPLEEALADVESVLRDAGLGCEERDDGARVSRWVDDAGKATFVFHASPELDAAMLEARGAAAPEILARVLDRIGFYAQSRLLGAALDVSDPECCKALRTLAHMVVAWDEDWTDLFLLHLASPDAVVRHEAVTSVSLAALVARDPEPAVVLLEEALRREKFPKLRDTIVEAIEVVRGATGGPVAPPAASS